MSAAARVRAAMLTTLALHLTGVLLAGALALGLERSLSAVGGHLVGGAPALFEPGGAYLIEAFDTWKSCCAREFAQLFVVVLGLALILAPWLEMSWVAALDAPRGFGASHRLGASRYVRAVALFLLQALATAPLLILSGLAPVGVHFVLAETPFIPLHDLAVLAALLPGLGIILLAACWVDLGRVALLPPGASVLGAAKVSLSRLRPRLALAYVGWLLAGLGLLVCGNALAAMSIEAAVPATLALGSAQLLLFGRSLCRARWLAGVLARERSA